MTVGVRLLGSPAIRHGEEWREAPLDKRLALLTYLACSESWTSRERLSYLFWPDTTTSNARINLRQLLARTRLLPLAVPIDADDERLRWTVDSDVTEFRRAIDAADWATALSTYRGELVADLVVDDDSEFANWLENMRSQLREAQRQAALQAAAISIAARRPEEAAAHYERLLTQDPLDESVMQLLLRLLVNLGAVEEASRRLKGFGKRLRAELDFAPSAATELIVANATSGQEIASEPEVRGAVNARPRHARVTEPLTSFVGRERELADTVQRLSSDSCRLLTLHGPGGVGKTRLALQAARTLVSRFTHGCVAIPLDQVPNAELLPLELAAALGLELRWQLPALDQLIDFLEPRNLLLILDGFEHLVDGALLIRQLLNDCPKLKVLVTSRQRLKLQGEWLLPLSGLTTPPFATKRTDTLRPEDAAAYDALVLLDERARQVEPGFTLTALTLPDAIAICHLLEGLPLGIELAAGWLLTRSIDQVRFALATSLDEPKSEAMDAEERHRTLRAVIDHSWQLLAKAQQRAARSLAVFTDGYDSAAARGVAGVSLPMLGSLSERSLLRRGADGRFDAHPLILRYLEERLAEEPSEQARLREAHASYYLRILRSWSSRVHGPEQPAMLDQFAPDYGNLSAAWLVALGMGWAARCLPAVEPLVLFHGVQGRFREGERLFAAGLERFAPRAKASDQGSTLLGLLEANYAWFLAGLARFDEATDHADSALSLTATESSPQVELRALGVLGSIASRRGDGAAAQAFLERGLGVAEAIGDRWGTGLILGQLGLLALRSSDNPAARAHFERALLINEKLGNTPGIVNDLDYLGRLSLASGDVAGAGATFERGLELAEGSRFRLRLPYLKTQLAAVKLALGQRAEAADLAREALEIAEELGQRALQAEALMLLGRAVQGEAQRSACFTRALALFDALGDSPRTLEVLLDLAQVPTRRVDPHTLLRLVAEHPATRPAQREQALALLSTHVRYPSRSESLLTLTDTVRQLLA